MAEPLVLRLGDPPGALRAALRRGEVAAIPTESSYGIAVDPDSAAAVERVFELKGRERGKPLPVVAAGLEQVLALGVKRADPALRWAMRYWPAPLTVLVEVARPLPAMAGASRLAVRVPAHAGLRRLLGELGMALTATSANLSGEPPITRANEVRERFGDGLAFVVDGGDLPGGPPSTVVTWTSEDGRPVVTRSGAFSWPR